MIADKDFILNNMGDEYVLSCRDRKKFGGMIRLNKSGAILWDMLKAETDKEALIEKILTVFDVDRDTAKRDMEKYVEKLISVGAIKNYEK